MGQNKLCRTYAYAPAFDPLDSRARHLGLLRSLLSEGKEATRSTLLVEMVARTLKNLHRGRLRRLQRTGPGSESAIKEATVDILNLVTVGAPPPSFHRLGAPRPQPRAVIIPALLPLLQGNRRRSGGVLDD